MACKPWLNFGAGLSFSISVELAGNKKKLEPWGLSKEKLNGKFGCGAAEAKFFPLLEKNLFSCSVMALLIYLSSLVH